jgi:hypothetical protein
LPLPTVFRALRGFEHRVLRRIFRPKGVEVTGKWRELHNEELHNFYISQNIIRVIKLGRMRWAVQGVYMEEEINACRILTGKPEGTRLTGKPRRRWEDNIRMDLRETWVQNCGLDSSGIVYGSVAGS